MRTKVQRIFLIGEHYRLVREGNYQLARRLFLFLNERRANLGICDVDWELSELFISLGMQPIHTNWRTGSAEYRL